MIHPFQYLSTFLDSVLILNGFCHFMAPGPMALWPYGPGPMALALWPHCPIFMFQEILEIDKISHFSIFS